MWGGGGGGKCVCVCVCVCCLWRTPVAGVCAGVCASVLLSSRAICLSGDVDSAAAAFVFRKVAGATPRAQEFAVLEDSVELSEWEQESWRCLVCCPQQSHGTQKVSLSPEGVGEHV